MKIRQLNIAPLLLALCMACAAPPGHASSIARLSSSDLLDKAQLIFQGEVVHRESWRAGNGMIYTTVEFHVQEVLKGSDPGPGLQLRFRGGSVAGTRLATGAVIPRPGERGIYFVRSLSRKLANPLVGWSQGHFTISPNNEVRGGNGALVTRVEAGESSGRAEVSRGIARGIRTQQPGEGGLLQRRALTPEEFKLRIRELWQLRGTSGGRRYNPAEATAKGGNLPPKPHGEATAERDPALWAREID